MDFSVPDGEHGCGAFPGLLVIISRHYPLLQRSPRIRSEYVTASPAGELESTPEKFTKTDKTKHRNFSSHSISLNTLQRVLGRILDKSNEPSFGSAFEDMATRNTWHSALGCIENKDAFSLRPLHLAFGAWKELNNDAWDCGSTWLEVKLPRAKARLWRTREGVAPQARAAHRIVTDLQGLNSTHCI